MSLTLYTPVDVPRLDLNTKEFWEFFDFHKDKLTAPRTTQNIPWVGFRIFGPPSAPNETEQIKTLPQFNDHFPSVLKHIETHLPMRLKRAVFYEQKSAVPPHHDPPEIILNALNSYRIMFGDPNLKNTFFVANPEDPKKKKHIELPPETNTFCFNNIGCRHGSDTPPPNMRKVVLLLLGDFDWPKHQELMHRSMKKYEKYIIKCEHLGINPETYTFKDSVIDNRHRPA